MSVDSAQIPITSPCPIDLDQSEVSVGDRRMFCDHCVKNVHLLSHMSEDEAREFMQEQAGENICVSYNVGTDGRIRFRSDAPTVEAHALSEADVVPTARLLRRVRRSFSPARFSAAASLGVMLAACAPHSEDSGPQIRTETTELVQIPDRVIPISHEVIADEPCQPEMQVDGGIEAVPLDKPIAVPGGITASPVPEPPPAPEPQHIRRGRIAPK